MITRAAPSSRATAALAAVAVIGVVAVVVALAGSGSAGVPGMPANVTAIVGRTPMVLTLHTDTLALVSEPDVQSMAQVQRRVAAEPFVAAAYGPTSWLSDQITALKASVRAHTTSKVNRADLLVRAGATSSLSLSDSTLMSTLVFGTGSNPVARIRWLFPNADASRLFIKLAPGANVAEAREVLTRLITDADLPGVTVTVSPR